MHGRSTWRGWFGAGRTATALFACSLLLFTVTLAAWAATSLQAEPVADDVRQAIIRQSIAAYLGNCPCPYSVMRNGRRCGTRSAYSKPGGYAPKCYPEDVTAAEIAAYRASGR